MSTAPASRAIAAAVSAIGGRGFDLPEVFDVVFVDEKVRLPGAGQAQKALVIKLDTAFDFLVVGQAEPNRLPRVGETPEVFDFFERLLGSFGF
jgi:hypothetical protein